LPLLFAGKYLLACATGKSDYDSKVHQAADRKWIEYETSWKYSLFFYLVTMTMPDIPRHPQAKLNPSELVTPIFLEGRLFPNPS